jgi:glycosyltransferase involved in cell wall biosynthesis
MTKSDEAIYINGRFLGQKCTGVQRYSREVVLAIDRLLARDDCPAMLRNQKWILLAPRGGGCGLNLDVIKLLESGQGGGHPWEQIHLARHSRLGRLLSLGNSGPIAHPRQLVVIHDAAIYNAPDGFARSYRAAHVLLDKFLSRTAKVATISQFSRSELARSLGIRSEDILLAPNGADHMRLVAQDSSIVNRLRLEPQKYFVTLGLSTANKNIPLAIEAYLLLNRPETKLVIVGEQGTRVVVTQKLAKSDGVILAGRLTDEEVTGLLRSAAALLFPSRYEGFGLPALEAMAEGCPVIASTAPAIVEVCGNAALHFDPDNAALLSDFMLRVLDYPDISAALRARGRRRGDRYKWEETAAVLMQGLVDLGQEMPETSRLEVAKHRYEKGVRAR